MTANFLWAPGTSNNGLLVSAVTLMSTELNSLTNTTGILSSANGLSTNGVFNNTLTGQGMIGDVVFTFGGIITPTTGSAITGWFIKSKDGGTTYEYSGAVPARAPDFYIPLINAASAANQQAWSVGTHGIIIPATYFKVYVQNNAGVTLPSSANTLSLVIPAAQY